MKVLVTGASGSIGGFVVRKFVEEGFRPVAFDLRIDDLLLSDIMDKIDFVTGDIRDAASVNEAIRTHGVDRIAHLAAVWPPVSEQEPSRAIDVNLNGTLNLLEAAVQNGVKRFVYASTKGVLGAVVGDHAYPKYVPLDEEYRIQPSTLYHMSKLGGELLGKNFHDRFGLEFAGLRFASIYGPGRGLWSKFGQRNAQIRDARCIVVENAMLGLPTKLAGGTHQLDDFVYVKDLANAFYSACATAQIKDYVFHIGTGVGKTIGDFADAVKTHFPSAQIDVAPGSQGYETTHQDYYCIFDITRARTQLGYEPQFDVEHGVADYLDTMKALKIEPTPTHF